MLRSLIIYAPPALLSIVALMLPQMGRNLVGRMNGREFVLQVAFWWMIVVVA